MSAESTYNKIMELPGLGEMKDVVRQWEQVAQNMPHQPTNVPLVLPNLFWKARSGAGKTNFLQLLSGYLEQSGLLVFYGDVKYFEFYLEYSHPDARLEGLRRLKKDMQSAAGFRSEYRGLVAIDISEWEGSFGEAGFTKVMEYLSSVDEKVAIVFVAENFPAASFAKAEQILSSFFRIRSVDFSYPTAQEFAIYSAERLTQYNLQLDIGAQNLLAHSIEELMKSNYFDGFKTINRLCQDIAFDLCSLPNMQNAPISESHLEAYQKNGLLITNLSKTAKLPNIGFGGER